MECSITIFHLIWCKDYLTCDQNLNEKEKQKIQKKKLWIVIENLCVVCKVTKWKKLRFYNEKEKSLFYFDFNSLDYCWTLGSQMKNRKLFR